MPNFKYTIGIPNAPNNPSTDQPNMKINNDSNASQWAVDHFGFGNNSGGWHQQATFPTRGSSDPTTTIGQGALYTNTTSGGTSLWFVRDNNLNTAVALTTAKVTAPKENPNGYSWLPGQILIQWGVETSIGATTPVLFAASNINFPTNIFSVTVSRNQNTSTSYGVGNVSTTGFDFNASVGTAGVTFFWIAIGK